MGCIKHDSLVFSYVRYHVSVHRNGIKKQDLTILKDKTCSSVHLKSDLGSVVILDLHASPLHLCLTVN